MPKSPTPLLGREREITATVDHLREPGRRLLTLTGPGGVGKTRLAIEAASSIAAHFSVASCFIPLAPVRDPALVLSVIAHALGLQMTGQAPIDGLRDLLRGHSLLMVLDNLEHLIEAAPTLAELLAVCPDLTVIATSRERLRLIGEQEYPVPPLALPERTRAWSTAALSEVTAVQLFVERAREVDPDFTLTDENSSAVAEICRRLDGLPLAIELAAARVKVLPPASLLARLERRLPLLIGGARDAPARQHTLRDTIAWSHDLLSPAEQVFFRRIAVFVGGFTLEAADAVSHGPHQISDDQSANDDGQTSMLDAVTSLVDKSLVYRDQRPGSEGGAEPRFGMLETIREFGLERLEVMGETGAARDAHAAAMVTLLERAEPEVVGRDQGAWLARLNADLDNIRVALAWTLDGGSAHAEVALQLAGLAWTFWYMSGRNREGRDWLQRALATSEGTTPRSRVQGLLALGTIYGTLAEFEVAEPFLLEAAASGRAIGFVSGAGRALQMLAMNLQQEEKHEQAKPLLEEALTLYGEPGEGSPHDQPWLGLALNQLADAVRADGDLDRAVAISERVLAHQQAIGSRPGIAFGHIFLADAVGARGESARALDHYREGMKLLWEQGDIWGLTTCLVMILGEVAATAATEQVVRVLGALETLQADTGHPLSPRYQAVYARVEATLRAQLGEAAFAAARAAGRTLTLEQAVTEALTLATAKGAPMVEPASAARQVTEQLTPREREILRLVATGQTDREIADALSIATRTVEWHLANILAKLDLQSRAAAASYAVRTGLA
ncbi:MAG: LuxR C-terminal-related transcriptional regulator [Chloroflexota bacterium]|nr:LuxR C-terminal-related transcriptional regulator [Chloroflexota bacterium]